MCWERIDPEHCIFHQMDEHNPWDAFERQHLVCAPGMVLDHLDVLLYVRYMFIGPTTVEEWETYPLRGKTRDQL